MNKLQLHDCLSRPSTPYHGIATSSRFPLLEYQLFSCAMGTGTLILALLLGSFAAPCIGADTESFTVNSPIKGVYASTLGLKGTALNALDSLPLFKSGEVDVKKAPVFIAEFVTMGKDSRVTILHVLRWADDQHKTVKFQKWYVYDPTAKNTGGFYLATKQSLFEGNAITGKTKFRLIYLHLNHVLGAPSESVTPDPTGATTDLVLKTPISYKVVITKQQTQFVQDSQTLLKIIGGSFGAQADDFALGYSSVFEFDSQYQTSLVTVSATLQGGSSPGGVTPDANANSATKPTQDKSATAANQLATQSYNNEKPSWIGLSVAVPLTSYKDASYDQTGGTISPKTINRQNIYAVADFYYPRVIPTFTNLRWLPHPLFGMPLKGQPLRNTMAGFGMGLHWLEPFAAVVFDDQEIPSSNKTATTNHMVYKLVWGLNISVSSAYKALSASKSSAATPSKSTTAK